MGTVVVTLKDNYIEDPAAFDMIMRGLERGDDVYVVLPQGEFRVVRFEGWDSFCLASYCEEHGIEIPDDPDEADELFWDVLDEAIREAMLTDGYDGYIYVDPYVCGEPYGCTLWLKRSRVAPAPAHSTI